MAGPQSDETQAHLSNARSLDNEAITQLRLDRWDHEFFKRKVEREQDQVQDTIKELENQLRLERKRVKQLELELKDMKEVLRIQTAQAEETESLQSEIDAYKSIAKAQWRSEVACQLHERRMVSVDAEESVELPRKRQTPMARDTRGKEED
jgi:DNA gyrase/topoisomerase IV subunit A